MYKVKKIQCRIRYEQRENIKLFTIFIKNKLKVCNVIPYNALSLIIKSYFIIVYNLKYFITATYFNKY